jgi:chromosome segregation ATPase
MVNEVESILNEIRERVRADHDPGAAPGSLEVQVEIDKSSLVEQQYEKSQTASTESLSRLSAHLTTTARAWDRLPPMFSNRKGGAARLELWIKARLKSMGRWFTWEQVNFNSAVHHALSETLNAQTAHEHELARLRAELSKETEARREQHARNNSELAALRASLDALATEIRKRDANLEARSAAIEARSAAIEARSAAIETRSAAIEARAAETAAGVATEISATRVEIKEARTEMTSRLAELAGELRESDEQLRAEQRVCFKQLSLEASETIVMEDRGRRVIESRLDKLEKTVLDGKD